MGSDCTIQELCTGLHECRSALELTPQQAFTRSVVDARFAIMTVFDVRAILRSDPLRWHLLGVVRALDLPDCWIGAGFVRNAIWDNLHQRPASPLTGDVDVIWFDPERADPAEDQAYEAALSRAEPTISWSVKNQSRMHVRNGDAPYSSATDAMCYWPETATAIAARRQGLNGCEIAAPFGIDDLVSLLLRPTPHFFGVKRNIYKDRVRTKGWTVTWPLLKEAET